MVHLDKGGNCLYRVALLWAACIWLPGESGSIGLAFGAERSEDGIRLPEVSFAELRSGAPAATRAAFDALSHLGALAVRRVMPGAVAKGPFPPEPLTRSALKAWADCLEVGEHSRETALVRPLAGGAVSRVSLMASGTWDKPPVALAPCPAAAHDTIAMRQGVRDATRALATALDAHRKEVIREGATDAGTPIVVRRQPDGSETSAGWLEVVDSGSHLEHLHVYQEAARIGSDANGNETLQALDMHTDAGLLLAFVPPTSATDASSRALEIEDARGQRVPLAPLPADAVIFFAGEASKLLRGFGIKSLRPLPHALALPSGFTWRAWYGAMVLLPENAVVQHDLHRRSGVTLFGELWNASVDHLTVTSGSVAPLACGRGLMLTDQAGACPQGTTQCWMMCMSTEGLEECKGGQWRPTGVGDIVEWTAYSVQCRDPTNGKRWPQDTGNMCSTCKPMCTLQSSLAPSPHPPPAPHPGSGSMFCATMGEGMGTTMYMSGFKWTLMSPDETCLTFLFEPLLVDTPWKLVLACVASIALGASVEVVALLRRRLPAKRHHDAGLFVHGASLSLAYLAMLVIMTYSIELCLATVLGLVLGHVIASYAPKKRDRRSFVSGAAVLSRSGSLAEDISGPPCCRLSRGLDVSDTPVGRQGSAMFPFDANLSDPSTPLTTQEVYLSIDGMTCTACAGTVQRALMEVLGVSRAEVSSSNNSARVAFAAPATAQALIDAVESVGFCGRLNSGGSSRNEGGIALS